MDDLREKLSEMVAWRELVRPPRSQREQAEIATLREALAHPERLMGEPVAWRYDCGSWTHLLSEPNDNYFSVDRGQSFVKGQPLFAPKEVKP